MDVRMRHELSNVLECSVAFETAQNVAACRLVLCMMLQTRMTARKRRVAQRTPVGIPGPAIYLDLMAAESLGPCDRQCVLSESCHLRSSTNKYKIRSAPSWRSRHYGRVHRCWVLQ